MNLCQFSYPKNSDYSFGKPLIFRFKNSRFNLILAMAHIMPLPTKKEDLKCPKCSQDFMGYKNSQS